MARPGNASGPGSRWCVLAAVELAVFRLSGSGGQRALIRHQFAQENIMGLALGGFLTLVEEDDEGNFVEIVDAACEFSANGAGECGVPSTPVLSSPAHGSAPLSPARRSELID